MAVGPIGVEKQLKYDLEWPHLFKIPLVRALDSVGSNLQDHMTTMLGPFFVNQPIVFDIVKFFTPSVVWEYLMKGTGIKEIQILTFCLFQSGNV